MTREDFVFKFEPELVGLVLDLFRTDLKGVDALFRFDKIRERIRAICGAQYDVMQPPKQPLPVKVEPKPVVPATRPAAAPVQPVRTP